MKSAVLWFMRTMYQFNELSTIAWLFSHSVVSCKHGQGSKHLNRLALTTPQAVTTPLDFCPILLHNILMTQSTPSMSTQAVDVDAIIADDMFITPYTDACYNEADVVETFDDLYGDDYADAMMAELGLNWYVTIFFVHFLFNSNYVHF